ncbi:sugar ABC transporter ATP-binding protein [Anaerofilum sp. BX8]|uniref:Ribose/galactose/methyl galactoside import ATP-binding protein n=1 Tax=Anaerofilum hominis TaxID=2763016 RepID=A0A923REK9_9FIRM|nr:sugar ABC transporter ATP-binding protein [Anaerofilum hominis]MBC5582347.1 sugar ABC transporter ATP-binding protein [Anaerofilum hominis]
MDNSSIVLEMTDISKSFPGVKALDKVSLTVRRGTVHALMGENGAGKSTLMKCAFGLYHPDEGEIRIEGETVRFQDARDAMDKGVSMIHQELHPIRTRNVMENIWVGRVPYKKIGPVHWVDEKKMYEDTRALFEDLEIHIDPRQSMGELAAAHCQLVEIARAVSYGAKVIIMDEPTSSLTEGEVELLFRIIRKLTAQGVAIIYISHKMDEILQISNEVTIMRDGQLVGCWPAEELTQDLIVARMVGRKMDNRFPPRESHVGEPWLEVEHLTSANPHSFQDISFTLHKGEILGLGGLVGAQRTELMESIFGLRPVASGTVRIGGKPVKIKCPQDAIQLGMALLTEERRASGIIPMLSVQDNVVLANQTAHTRQYTGGRLFLSEKKRRDDAQQYIDSLSIKTPTQKTQIQNLSGGNQQKVLLGRWMLTEPEILILDEPTRGIDVGAKYEIYTLMTQMAAEGKCVIMISSEMPELMGMSDRIMVMCEGHLSGILDGKTATDEQIMMLASTYQGAAEGGVVQ